MRALRTGLLIASLAVLAFGPRAMSHHGPHAAMQSRPSTAEPGRTGSHDGVSAPQHAARELERLADTYTLLNDVSVVMGDTPNGEQAVAYYTSGRIVIDRDHRVDIDTILAHEIWHIIDWRDNGRIDWGEDLPPHDAEAYLAR